MRQGPSRLQAHERPGAAVSEQLPKAVTPPLGPAGTVAELWEPTLRQEQAFLSVAPTNVLVPGSLPGESSVALSRKAGPSESRKVHRLGSEE